MTVSWIINHFLFFEHIFNEEFFLLSSPSHFEVCQSYFGLATFSNTFSFKVLFFLLFDCSLDVISSILVDFPIYVETTWFEKLKIADISKPGHVVASFLYKCIKNKFICNCTKCYYIWARNKTFRKGGTLAIYIWCKKPSLCRVNLKTFSKIKAYITNTVLVEK